MACILPRTQSGIKRAALPRPLSSSPHDPPLILGGAWNGMCDEFLNEFIHEALDPELVETARVLDKFPQQVGQLRVFLLDEHKHHPLSPFVVINAIIHPFWTVYRSLVLYDRVLMS